MGKINGICAPDVLNSEVSEVLVKPMEPGVPTEDGCDVSDVTHCCFLGDTKSEDPQKNSLLKIGI